MIISVSSYYIVILQHVDVIMYDNVQLLPCSSPEAADIDHVPLYTDVDAPMTPDIYSHSFIQNIDLSTCEVLCSYG